MAVGVSATGSVPRTKREAGDGSIDRLLEVLRLARGQSTDEADVGTSNVVVQLGPGDIEQGVDQLAMRRRIEQ